MIRMGVSGWTFLPVPTHLGGPRQRAIKCLHCVCVLYNHWDYGVFHANVCCLWPLLHPFNSLFSRTTWVSQYQKGKTSLDLNQTRDNGFLGWQWHQLDHMQTIWHQTDSHTNTLSFSFYRPDALSDAQPTLSKHRRHNVLSVNAIKMKTRWEVALADVNRTVSTRAPMSWCCWTRFVLARTSSAESQTWSWVISAPRWSLSLTRSDYHQPLSALCILYLLRFMQRKPRYFADNFCQKSIDFNAAFTVRL